MTVMNHHAISGERMSFDALVSFEYEDYADANERTSTCPFNCSNHGYAFVLVSLEECACVSKDTLVFTAKITPRDYF